MIVVNILKGERCGLIQEKEGGVCVEIAYLCLILYMQELFLESLLKVRAESRNRDTTDLFTS